MNDLRRLPIEPLQQVVDAWWAELLSTVNNHAGNRPLESNLITTEEAFRFKWGYQREAYYRWVRNGTIPIWTADRFCVNGGLHPRQVWGEAWDEIPDNREGPLEVWLAAEHLGKVEAGKRAMAAHQARMAYAAEMAEAATSQEQQAS